MTGAALMGGNDLTGLHIIKALLDQSFFTRVDCISYRPPLDVVESDKLHIQLDFSCCTNEWPAQIARLTSMPAVFFSQRLVDYEANLNLANAARRVGVRVYVMTAPRGAEVKDILRDALQAFGFKTIVIVRPGDLSVGPPTEQPVRKTLDFYGVAEAIVVARAAVSAAQQALELEMGTVWELRQSDIVRLGLEEWDG
ncbi:hypothetical protein K3495_g2068 [Podosphaera aphanis]|nr:hypothetical protein K3495_g2068 [Podosphaera aphanis]